MLFKENKQQNSEARILSPSKFTVHRNNLTGGLIRSQSRQHWFQTINMWGWQRTLFLRGGGWRREQKPLSGCHGHKAIWGQLWDQNLLQVLHLDQSPSQWVTPRLLLPGSCISGHLHFLPTSSGLGTGSSSLSASFLKPARPCAVPWLSRSPPPSTVLTVLGLSWLPRALNTAGLRLYPDPKFKA